MQIRKLYEDMEKRKIKQLGNESLPEKGGECV